MEEYWLRKLSSTDDKKQRLGESSANIYFIPSAIPGTLNDSDAHDLKEVVAQKNHHDTASDIIIPLLATIAGLVVILSGTVLFLLTRKRGKKDDEENQTTSILVYPAQQGQIPQFLMKEIHFSLPPMRSSSMSDLGHCDQDDSDHEYTEALIPPNTHSQRSNSFSCYGLGVIEPALYKSTLDLDELQWPEGHLGRIWFSLRYEPATEKLLVSLLKAKNLPSRTVGTVNSCDPFVRLSLLPDERRYLQSKQKKKTCNPYFDETLVFQVSAKDMTDHVLKLTVIDSGRPKRKQILGHVTFPLRDLDTADSSEQQLFKLDLEKEERRKAKRKRQLTSEAQEHVSDMGELLVSLLYNENLKRLTATVIEARKLKLQDDRREVYVKVTLNQQYRPVKEKKTGIARISTDETVTFTECFNLRLPNNQVDVTSVSFHVYQVTSGYGRDKLIGKCVLGSFMFARGRALSHWTSVIANPMEQVQQWHVLCE